jgi:hypothetical protein
MKVWSRAAPYREEENRPLRLTPLYFNSAASLLQDCWGINEYISRKSDERMVEKMG